MKESLGVPGSYLKRVTTSESNSINNKYAKGSGSTTDDEELWVPLLSSPQESNLEGQPKVNKKAVVKAAGTSLLMGPPSMPRALGPLQMGRNCRRHHCRSPSRGPA